MNDICISQDSEQPPGAQPHERDTGMTGMLVAFSLMFITLGLLVAWPYTKQYIPGLADPAQVQPLGLVTRVTYVGGFTTRTQVEVGPIVLLVRDAVELPQGVLVERRTSVIDDRLCVVGSERCHEIVSH